MFDIGFWELVLISVIGLVVLGPERLPHAIRSVMHWVTTIKEMANSVKTEVTQELKLHEINENMIKASKKGLNDLDPELQKSIDEMKETADQLSRPYKKEIDDLKTSLNKNPSGTSQQENSILDRSKSTAPTQDKNE
ncbi:MAG: sec-independent protein translocase protein TatB [Psychromonas sp.]|jgi:sec-independent protein translocase protein TatB|uniref:Sec-independent protein translocase protein TatB n=1 Tax=Psychromonas sp. TaxID=1884585 RepID=UPI0039E72021